MLHLLRPARAFLLLREHTVMADPFDRYEIDITTGLMTIGTRQVNYRDYFEELDLAIEDHTEALKSMRDPKSDLQNLWGRKEDGFMDAWFHRARPINRPIGYADEFKEDDWQVGV